MLTVNRASLLVSIGVTLAAALCGCPMDPPADVPDAGMVDARDTAEVGPMDRVTPDDGPPPADVPDARDVTPVDGARCEFDEGYAYGFEGGNTASTDTAVLSPRREYTLRREYTEPGRMPDQCMTQLPACGAAGMLNMSDVLQAIGHPDVVRALEAPGPELVVYGHDSRPKDGQVFGFRRVADGHGFYVGEPCGGRPGCTEIPAGLGELVGVLFALDQQERARPACAMLR